jgi:hypothetical protein
VGWRRAVIVGIVVAAVAVLLFLAYLGQAGGIGFDSDNASAVLQGDAMAHGNVLLRGWYLSDVSFFTTELPQYALVTLVHGVNAEATKLAAAMTYTLLVLLAAFAAKGRATGREAGVRVLVTTVVLLAPQAVHGTAVVLSGPDHVGTLVPLLVAWILLDRLPERRYLPVAVGALLCWTEVADQMAVYVGALPLALVAAFRLYRRPRSPVDLGLLVGAVVSVPAADLVLYGIRAVGGFHVWPADTSFATAQMLPHNARVTYESILLIFGGDFSGMTLRAATLLVLVHLIGLALAVWGFVRVVQGRVTSRLEPILAAGMAIDLLAYLFGTQAVSANAAREIAPVLVYGAVLAGRMVAGRIRELRLVPVLLVVLTLLAGSLAHNAARPAVPLRSALGSWLAGHHLTHGVGDYWVADMTTVQTGGRVTIAPIAFTCHEFRPYLWEADTRWYDPAANDADFVVLDAKGRSDGTVTAATRAFGPPATTVAVDGFTVLVYRRNLLESLPVDPDPKCLPGY